MASAPRALRKFSVDRALLTCWFRTFFPSAALFLLTAAFILSKTARDALYFQRDGWFHLPKAYLLIALLAGPSAGATLALMRLLGPRRARVAAILVLAGAQMIFHRIAVPGSGLLMTVVWVLIPMLFGVVLSLVWLLGADLLDRVPNYLLARLYSSMGAASMMGGLTGAAIARQSSGSMEPQALYLVSAGLLLATAIVTAWAHYAFPVVMSAHNPGPVPAPGDSKTVPLPEMWRTLRHRYTKVLALVAVVTSIVGVFIEFQFYWSASEAGLTGRAAMQFFANFYAALNAAAILVQLLATPYFQRLFGVYGSLMILPAALIGAVAAVIATGTRGARAALRVAEGGIKSSIHRSNWEQSYLPLERGERAVAKLLVDGMAARFGEGIAAGLLILWVEFRAGIDVLGWGMLAGTLAWLALASVLRDARRAPGLIPMSLTDLRPDLPIPDG
jgi:hypothetical protein